eukprot:1160360-Pelagomonas_calceolata.AAC.8
MTPFFCLQLKHVGPRAVLTLNAVAEMGCIQAFDTGTVERHSAAVQTASRWQAFDTDAVERHSAAVHTTQPLAGFWQHSGRGPE